MSENDTQACPAIVPEHTTGEDLNKTGAEDSINVSQNNSVTSDSEPSAKKPRESRRSKGPHKRVDDLAAAEAKAVCGEVDTSAGRQLRKRDPPAKVEPKPKATSSRGKKDTTPAKKGSPAKKAKEGTEENESKSSEQENETPLENSTKDEPSEAKDEAKKDEATTPSVGETKETSDNAVTSHDGQTNDSAAGEAVASGETKPAETPAAEAPVAVQAATE